MQMKGSGITALMAVCVALGAGATYLMTRSATPAPEASPSAVTETAATDAAPAQAAEPPASATSGAAPAQGQPGPGRTATSPASQAAAPVAPAAAPAPAPTASAATPTAQVAPEAPRQATADAPRAKEPDFEEVVVESDAVLGLQIENTISSETAKVEDAVTARITREVRVGNRVVIPAGVRVNGEVVEVERGGKVREKARIAVRFTSMTLAGGTRVPLSTELIVREGESPTRESAAKIGGGAIGGAIIGGLIGGGKGAVVGSTAGAGAGTAAVLAGGRNPAVLAAGTPVTARLTRSVSVPVGK